MNPTHQEIAVRSAVTGDVPTLVELLNAIIRVGGTTAYEVPLTPGEFEERFLSGEHIVAAHVAQVANGGDPAGFQTIEFDAELPKGWVDIATFARLAPKISGVGRALFAATLRSARQLDLEAINATIRADNVSGLGYYDRMGFVTYRTIRAVPLLDGTPVDRICKRFDLGTVSAD